MAEKNTGRNISKEIVCHNVPLDRIKTSKKAKRTKIMKSKPQFVEIE